MWRSDGWFIDATTANAVFLHGSHNPWLVVLSVGVAIFSACMALQTAHIARSADLPLHRQLAIGTGSIALGGGIWTMHFIGMLSFELCAKVSYDPSTTVLSILPGWLASWVALQLLVRPVLGLPLLVAGGVLVGLGIGAMHYTGMAAMRLTPLLRYDPGLFALSIGVAVVLAVLALWVRYGMRRTTLSPLGRLLASGTVMGLAIAGMHYVGMMAARFIGEPETPEVGMLLDSTFASLALSTFTITLTVFVTSANGLLRFRQLFLKMQASESRTRAIVETAIDGIITIDSRGIVQDYNRSAERLFGWKAQEVVGQNIKMLMPDPDRSRHDDYLRNYMTSGIPRIIGVGREVTGLRKNGSLMPMRLAVGRVDQPGDPLFVGFVTDITEYRNLENSLRETAHHAEQAAAAKSTFLANMSHEIRTPMNAIIGFTELLLKGELTALQRRHLGTIQQSARSLLALLNDILDTTKLEKGAFELENVDFSFKALVEQVMSSLRLGAESKGLGLSLQWDAALDEYHRGDPLRIQQVLTNLLSNAIKFTEQGRVDLAIDNSNGMVHVQIRDTGIGMTPEQVRTIFDPFAQADASISRRFGGTGLGTTIVRQLVDLMGGTIRVESAPGAGTTFHVWLPLAKGNPPVQRSVIPHTDGLPPLKILVADDVPQNLELLALSLQEDGRHQIVLCDNGEEAVARFAREPFDIVLMDVHMPQLDGLEATRRIRQIEQTQGMARIPVIALTASVMESDQQAAREAGMDGFAVKPLDLPRLRLEMARVLGEKAKVRPEPPPVAQTPDQIGENIDWATGVNLWGSATRLARGIQNFLAGAPELLAFSGLLDTDQAREAALFSLHRLRGVTGNLALPRLSGVVEQLDDDIRQGRTSDIRAELGLLREILAEIDKALRESGAYAEIIRAKTPERLGPAGIRTQVEQLKGSLRRSQLDDAALRAIGDYLRAQGAQVQADQLEDAIDAFDFDKAVALLCRLHDDLSASLDSAAPPSKTEDA